MGLSPPPPPLEGQHLCRECGRTPHHHFECFLSRQPSVSEGIARDYPLGSPFLANPPQSDESHVPCRMGVRSNPRVRVSGARSSRPDQPPSVGSVCAGTCCLRNTIVASGQLLRAPPICTSTWTGYSPDLFVGIAARLTRVATRRDEERFVSFDNDPSPVCPPGQAVVEKKKRIRQSLTRVGLYEYGEMRFTKSEVTEIDLTQVRYPEYRISAR